MGVPKRLTEMQQRFAEFLVFGGPDGPMTQSEAALAAGYSPKRARQDDQTHPCLLYTSPSPRDGLLSRMPSSA